MDAAALQPSVNFTSTAICLQEYNFESGTAMEDPLNVFDTRVPEVKVERKVSESSHFSNCTSPENPSV